MISDFEDDVYNISNFKNLNLGPIIEKCFRDEISGKKWSSDEYQISCKDFYHSIIYDRSEFDHELNSDTIW